MCSSSITTCIYIIFHFVLGMVSSTPTGTRIYPFPLSDDLPHCGHNYISWNYIIIKRAMSSRQFAMNQKASGSQFVRMQNINWLQFRNEAQGRFRSQLFMAHNIVTRLQLNSASLIINWHIASDWKFSPPGNVIWWLNHVILLFWDWLCILSEVIRHYCPSFATFFSSHGILEPHRSVTPSQDICAVHSALPVPPNQGLIWGSQYGMHCLISTWNDLNWIQIHFLKDPEFKPEHFDHNDVAPCEPVSDRKDQFSCDKIPISHNPRRKHVFIGIL